MGHIKIPHLSNDKRFAPLLDELRLQKRGTGGVDSAATGGTFDISNSDRLGKSEVQLVQQLIDGINLIIEMEKRLESRRSIEDLMPEKLRTKKLGLLGRFF